MTKVQSSPSSIETKVSEQTPGLLDWTVSFASRRFPFARALLSTRGLEYLLKLGVLSSVAGAIVSAVRAWTDQTMADWVTFWTSAMNVSLMFIFVILILPQVGKSYASDDHWQGKVEKYRGLLYMTCGTWLFLYLVMGIEMWMKLHPPVADGGAPPESFVLVGWLLAAMSQLLNILSAVLIGLMYELLSSPSEERGHQARWVIWVVGGVVAIFSTISLALNGNVGGSAMSAIATSAGIANGLFVGALTALYVARIESAYIGLSTPAVVGLSVYAIIQPLFIYVIDKKQPGIVVAVLLCAFLLKLLLVVTSAWLVDTGVLHFYFEKKADLDQGARAAQQRHRANLLKPNSEEYILNVTAYPPRGSRSIVDSAKSRIRLVVGIRNDRNGTWKLTGVSFKSINVGGLPIEFIKAEFQGVSEHEMRPEQANAELVIFVDFHAAPDVAAGLSMMKGQPCAILCSGLRVECIMGTGSDRGRNLDSHDGTGLVSILADVI